MLRRKLAGAFLFYAFLLPMVAFGQMSAPATKVYAAPDDVIAKIKDEGMNRSQVMQTLSYLTDVIGPRLTGSPQLKRAGVWTRDQMLKWGLQNGKLEAWGPFGRGWQLKSFSAEVVAPQAIPLVAYPKAWSPSTKGTVTGDVVYLDAKTDADLEKYKGQLTGKIVLVSEPRETKAAFEGFGTRYTEEGLSKLANAPDPASVPRTNNRQGGTPEQIQQFFQRAVFNAKRMNLLVSEGAAVLVDNSFNGSGGTVFVSGAAVAQDVPTNPMEAFGMGRNRLQPYQKEAEAKMIPQITLSSEQYNRIVRMIRQGEKPRMTVDLQAEYQDADLMNYNTTAEIPGTDPNLKDQIVMLGGHLDSWQGGTGTTDDAAGCAVVLEAVRIIQALGLKPRRTIRAAMWTGEEQGLLGSRAYVKQQFGEMQGGSEMSQMARAMGMGGAADQTPPTLVKKPDYDKLSAYFNLDNGTGRIRGVYMQGNSAARPIFEQWLAPFKDTGATTLTLSNTGGTDHLSYNAIGLPGFQFIQDEIEYGTRTHHSTQDVFDRAQADDLKQAATIMAAFVYQAAMMDDRFPRKEMK